MEVEGEGLRKERWPVTLGDGICEAGRGQGVSARGCGQVRYMVLPITPSPDLDKGSVSWDGLGFGLWTLPPTGVWLVGKGLHFLTCGWESRSLWFWRIRWVKRFESAWPTGSAIKRLPNQPRNQETHVCALPLCFWVTGQGIRRPQSAYLSLNTLLSWPRRRWLPEGLAECGWGYVF